MNFRKIHFTIIACIHTICVFAQQNDTIEIQRNNFGKIINARFQSNEDRKMSNGENLLRKILETKKEHQFRLIKETTDDLGFNHQRYAQYWKGVRIDNAEYLVHGRNGILETINGEYPEIDTVNILPRITEISAITRALNYVGAARYKWEDGNLEKMIKE